MDASLIHPPFHFLYNLSQGSWEVYTRGLRAQGKAQPGQSAKVFQGTITHTTDQHTVQVFGLGKETRAWGVHANSPHSGQSGNQTPTPKRREATVVISKPLCLPTKIHILLQNKRKKK